MLEQSCHNHHLSKCQRRASCVDAIPGECTAFLHIFISQTCSAVFKKKPKKEMAYLHLMVEVGRYK